MASRTLDWWRRGGMASCTLDWWRRGGMASRTLDWWRQGGMASRTPDCVRRLVPVFRLRNAGSSKHSVFLFWHADGPGIASAIHGRQFPFSGIHA
ncbi:MAG: hypothetical protein HFH32_13670 [Eubacterium sp.]|nr:hypothetical protein [Eubacterium sp.]